MKRSIMLALVVMSALLLAPFSAVAAPERAGLLQNMEAEGVLLDELGGAAGNFVGTVTVTEVGYDTGTGFWVSGVVSGTATPDGGEATEVEQAFTRIPSTLNESSGAVSARGVMAQQRCQILFLDIGPIFLNLLGLELDLSEIVLDLTAVSGPGNLLGNLLCAVAGLLDPGGLLNNLLTGLNRLLAILDRINDILG